MSTSVNIKDWYLTFKSYKSSKSFDAGFYIQIDKIFNKYVP